MLWLRIFVRNCSLKRLGWIVFSMLLFKVVLMTILMRDETTTMSQERATNTLSSQAKMLHNERADPRETATSTDKLVDSVRNTSNNGESDMEKPGDMSSEMHQRSSIPKRPPLEKHNVVFVKTHKTGSTTVSTVFFRYGWKRNLTFVIGKNGNQFNYPNKFTQSYIKKLELSKTHTGEYNILCNHQRFSTVSEYMKFMPADTVFVTIVRDPATRFRSHMKFFFGGSIKCFNLTDRNGDLVAQFLSNIDSYTKRRKKGETFCASWQDVHDGSLHDLGWEESETENETVWTDKVNEMAKIFGLVMTMELIDESLIFLKDMMGWKLQDVMYFRKRQFYDDDDIIPEVSIKKLREWNAAETFMWRFFTKILEDKIDQFGKERMQKEVAELRNLNRQWREKCEREEKQNESYECGLLKRDDGDYYLLLANQYKSIQRT